MVPISHIPCTCGVEEEFLTVLVAFKVHSQASITACESARLQYASAT